MDSSPSQRHRDVPKWKGKNHHLIEEEESSIHKPCRVRIAYLMALKRYAMRTLRNLPNGLFLHTRAAG